jgi:hypothetical protein
MADGNVRRDSASQGALAEATLAQQGVITEAAYEEQAKSFDTMSATARMTAASEEDMATKTDTIATEQEGIAGQQQSLADQAAAAGKTAMWGDIAGGLLKGVAAVASEALAPETGGLSLAATMGLDGLGAIH